MTASDDRRREERRVARERSLRDGAIGLRKASFVRGEVIRFEGWAPDQPDEYSRLTPGTLGVVNGVDDGGTVHARWADGSSLGMMLEDRFEAMKLLAPKIDGVTHFARLGHTLALCGAERLTNADVDSDVEAWCAECLLIANTERSWNG